jgi:hypothetical protein
LNTYCEQSRQTPVENWYYTEFEKTTSPQLFGNLAKSYSGSSASVDILIPTPLAAPQYYQTSTLDVRAFLLPGTDLNLNAGHDTNDNVMIEMFKQNFDVFFDSVGHVHQFVRAGGYGYCDVNSDVNRGQCKDYPSQYRKADCKPESRCTIGTTETQYLLDCKAGSGNVYSPCESSCFSFDSD